MKKENFIIGLIGVAVVAFLLGRFSVSTTPKKADEKSTATTKTDEADKDEVAAKVENKATEKKTAGTTKPGPTPKVAKQVEADSGKKPGAGTVTQKPTPADLAKLRRANIKRPVRPTTVKSRTGPGKKPAAVVRRLPPARPGTPLKVVDSPRKGVANAKVTIVEVSDFQ